ncbi:MAG TPA: FAD-dependent oxidoreductase, partial [Candidatus Methylacidiphilales bacterium]|nr:FAD-dependent oxidoreductase [Candidatus Methylacidiphilales bacterium]
VIIGGGYSGTMVAVHLARAHRGLRIALVERGKAPGRGVAYGTTDPKHLLNVRASQMGAFPDDIGHFYCWLQAHPNHLHAAGITEVHPDAFIPRLVFGDYIQDLLQEACTLPGRPDLIRDEITDLARHGEGAFELTTRGGRRLHARRVVLALGNFPPGEARRADAEQPRYLHDPYSPQAHAQLAEPGDILIVGTGLTTLDVLLTLDQAKAAGKIHVLSRRGQFPQPHRKAAPYPPFLDARHLPRTARLLFRRVAEELRRAAQQGIDWRPVIDSLRPLHQAIWQNLNLVEKRRFLRHLRNLWDTHRHRCAPEIMAVKERLEAEGRLVCHAGYTQDFEQDGEHVVVRYRPRGTQTVKEMRVRYVLNCTGPQADYRKLNDPLVRQLLIRDLLAPDPLRLGVSTAADGQLRNEAGRPIHGLYTLGSPRLGGLYESIAVPELRRQAADLAAHLITDFDTEAAARATPLLAV